MCRTANGYDVNWKDSWKEALMEAINTGDVKVDVLESARQKDGRGNICPTTIIMPTLAMQAKDKVITKLNLDKSLLSKSFNECEFSDEAKTLLVEEFMKLLEKKITEAKDSLIERFDWICSQPAKSAQFMYENGTIYGYKPEEGIRSALKHGTLAIGQLGLAETLQIIIGCDHTVDEGMNLAIRIESLFKDKCAKFKKDNKLNFGVYYTPAENLCYTAMNKFKDKYGEIKDVSDRDFFTNSMHVPVWKKMTPFEKIDIESKLTGFSSAGCITYVELDSSAKNNINAMEELVNYAMDKDVPYFAVNVPIDMCMKCGYQDDLGNECPKCGSSEIQRLRRVTGYITGNFTTAFNQGKQEEVKQRSKHSGIKI